MKLPDVNVLVYAHRAESLRHAEAARWLERAVMAHEPLGLVPSVVAGFVRIVTNPRVFADPTPLDVALRSIDALAAHPGVVSAAPGAQHWTIFRELCVAADARGNLVSDAALAAVSIEHDATWVTFDRDFARFAGLRWEVPGADRMSGVAPRIDRQ